VDEFERMFVSVFVYSTPGTLETSSFAADDHEMHGFNLESPYNFNFLIAVCRVGEKLFFCVENLAELMAIF
jgi:hypothetical protein